MVISDLTLKELALQRPDLVEAILNGEHEGSTTISVGKDADNKITKWIEKKYDIDGILISERIDDYHYFDTGEIGAIVMHWYEEDILITKKTVRDSIDTTKYYVSNTGDDSWDGHYGQPWKTISKVNSMTFNPRDSILFKKGDIWRELLSIPDSGSSDKPILFGAYGKGDMPIITGANNLLLSYTWHLSVQGKNCYYVTPAPLSEVEIVYADDEFLLLSDDDIITNDHHFKWTDNDDLGYNTLYIKDISGIPGSGFSSIEGGARNRCIYIYSKNYIIIDGIEERLSNQLGIDISGTSEYVNVQNCKTFGIDDQGIQAGGDTRHCVIDNCITSYTCPHKKAGAKNGIVLKGAYHTVQNCDVHSNGLPNCDNEPDPGGNLYDARGITLNTIDHGKVINNRLWDNTGACIEGYNATNCLISKNINYTSWGPEWKRGCDNTELSYNIWHQASHSKSPKVIPNGGGSYGDWNGFSSINLKLYNNIFFRIPVFSLSDGSIVILKNNIFANSSYYQVYSDQIAGLVMNNNYFVSDCQGYPDIVKIQGGLSYTLAEWQSVSGQDINSMTGESVFVNPENDFHLLPESVCIDAGVDVGLMEDFEGNSIIGLPDIGAFEYISKKGKL